MADDGFFQINDVVLDVPPEQISIRHKAFYHQSSTLRTRGNIHLNSNLGECFINTNIIFEGAEGLSNLRNLISQFRVTPFCYINNQYLRDNIFSGNQKITMVFGVQDISISCPPSNIPSAVDAVSVQISFVLFNYFPFTPRWSYKKDILSLEEVHDPKQSMAWKRLYSAEQKRAYRDGSPYKVLLGLDSNDVVLKFNHFTTITVEKFNELSEEYNSLRNLNDSLNTLVDGESEFVSNEKIIKAMQSKLKNRSQAEILALHGELFGNKTSFGKQKGTAKQISVAELRSILGGHLNPKYYSRYDIILNASQYNLFLTKKNGSEKKLDTVKIPKNLLEKVNDDKTSKEETLVVYKEYNLSLEQLGFVINGISISFRHQLAPIPLLSSKYPAYQHINSGDFQVSISMSSIDEQPGRDLSGIRELIDSGAYQSKLIPRGHRNLKITNDLINMCGLKYFLIDTIITQTAGPSQYAYMFQLIEDSVNPVTREQLTQEGNYLVDSDIRETVWNIIKDKYIIADYTNSFGQIFSFTRNNKKTPSESKKREFVMLDLGSKFSFVLDEALESLGNTLSSTFGKNPEKFGEYSFLQFMKYKNNFVVEYLQRTYIRKLKQLSNTKTKKNGLINGLFIPKEFTTDIDFLEITRKEVQAYREGYLDIEIEENLQKKLNLILNKAVRDIYRIIDEDVLTDLVFTEPKFAAIANKILNRKLEITSSSCYPDFPMKEILDNIKDNEPELYQELSDKIQDLMISERSILKGLDASIFIKPDFYLFNKKDLDSNIMLDQNIQRTIADTAKESNKDQLQDITKDYFKDYYKPVLGNAKFDKVDNITKKFYEELVNKYDNAEQGESEEESDENQEDEDNAEQAKTSNEDWKSFFEEVQDQIDDIDASISQIAIGSNSGPIYSYTKSNTEVEMPEILVEHQNGLITNIADKEVAKASSNASKIKNYPDERVVSVGNRTHNIKPTGEFTWYWPTNNPKVTSGFGDRNKVPHYGVDIRAGDGDPIYAVADGKIIKVFTDPNKEARGGLQITMEHNINGTKYYSKYFHLKRNGSWVALAESLINKTIGAGTYIAQASNTGTARPNMGPHLHLEIREKKEKGKPIPFTSEKMSRLLDGRLNRFYGSGGKQALWEGTAPIKLGRVPEVEKYQKENSLSYFETQILELDKETREQFSSPIRAWPTFKLFFIESDLGERKYFSFDDFFSYSAVREIKVIRNKHLPADLYIISLTNISGVLTNRSFNKKTGQFDNDEKKVAEAENKPEDTNTVKENSFVSVMLKPGTQIQLRMGYSSNPNMMPEVNGIITDVGLSESDDVVNIICQSFGIELTQQGHGEGKKTEFGTIGDPPSRTGEILEYYMSLPEVVHFGRWEPGDSKATTIGNEVRNVLTERWTRQPQPQDNNIFIQTGGGISGIFEDTGKYIVWNNTIWDVFQEMTLRHPGYIAYPVPYEGKYGPRMTMFFGLPDSNYFARDPSSGESQQISQIKRNVKDNVSNEKKKRQDKNKKDDLKKNKETLSLQISSEVASNETTTVGNNIQITDKTKKEIEFQANKAVNDFVIQNGIAKPFRNYHLLTSQNHIISNNIVNSQHDTFNYATIWYSDADPKASEVQTEIDFNNMKSFTVAVEAGIPDEQKRELFLSYPNCHGKYQAQEYCMSALRNSMASGYGGSIVIVGNFKIKPYDICFIYDTYTDMYGPIEVEQVVHSFDERGFVTEITPNMLVHVNQTATMTTEEAMGLLCSKYLNEHIGETATSVLDLVFNNPVSYAGGALMANTLSFGLHVGAAILPGITYNGINVAGENSVGKGNQSLFSVFPAWLFGKFITRSQLKRPFYYSFLYKNGKPMIGGTPYDTFQTTILKDIDNWFIKTSDSAALKLDNMYDSYSLSNIFGYSEGSLMKSIFGGNK